eukprot:CAMPEP_0183452356 /NCGR_PEP_ID=MMETSP0370-20130417/117663_1 /TAXON_ID=268820 /ORGANISM="Peridinium aciculiferum, Strain PAER-2" /LENGTH=46 /DNA_ID= /DNA_START= /DNA_END= /DNA_ORIENTATION=
MAGRMPMQAVGERGGDTGWCRKPPALRWHGRLPSMCDRFAEGGWRA